jgi:hypothetical protein
VEAVVGEVFIEDGRATVPLEIHGHATSGGGKELGEMRLGHGFDREAAPQPPRRRFTQVNPLWRPR